MKLIFSLSTLFLIVSSLLLQTESYTSSLVKNEAILSIVREENALISITFVNGKKFEIKNNSYKTIEIVSLEVVDEPDHKIVRNGGPDSQIIPNQIKDFNIIGDPKDLTGKVLKIKVSWEDGSAEINSTIPDLKDKE